jgi:hypothetical protein
MRFVTGRLIFGGAGSITVNRAIVSQFEVEMATYEVELADAPIEVELAAPIEAEVAAPIEVEID